MTHKNSLQGVEKRLGFLDRDLALLHHRQDAQPLLVEGGPGLRSRPGLAGLPGHGVDPAGVSLLALCHSFGLSLPSLGLALHPFLLAGRSFRQPVQLALHLPQRPLHGPLGLVTDPLPVYRL